MKNILIAFTLLFLQISISTAQSTDIPSTIKYINEVLNENKRYFGYQQAPNDHFKSKSYNQRCYSDYIDKITLSNDGSITIIRTIFFCNCSDPVDNGNKYSVKSQSFHHEDVSRTLTSLDDVKIVLRAKNNKKVFSYFKPSNEYVFWEFKNSYDAERCFNALSHLLKLLNSDSRYKRRTDDPFAPQNYNQSSSPSTYKHTSNNYNYTINAPTTFKKTTSNRSNIDTKLVDNSGASIIVNVSKRLPEEYGLTGHSYSADYFRNLYRNQGYNITIHKSSKTTVAGQPAFKMVFDNPVNNRLRVLEYSFFKGSYAYVLTCSCEKGSFGSYEEIFRQAAISMKFK